MRRKALMVGQIFMFMMGVTFFIIFMVLGFLSGEQDRFNQKVDVKVDYQMSIIKHNAVLTVLMEDHIWRPDAITKGSYDNAKARELLTLYYSTEGSSVLYVHGRPRQVTTVRDDLETYLEYKMEKYWKQSTTPAKYRLEVSGSEDKKPPIVLGELSRGAGVESAYSLPTAGGGKVSINMWVEGGDGAIGVTRDQ